MIPAGTRVRYIKLGEGGSWEKECLEKGIIRYGFGSASAERFPLGMAGCWNELTNSFVREGKDQATATRFTNETRIFFEDDGSILWNHIYGRDFSMGFLERTAPVPHTDAAGVWRKVAKGWSSSDLNGEPLTKDRLSGALTKLAAYPGTACKVDVEEYVVRRINGRTIPQVERAVSLVSDLRSSVLELMRLLGPRDFETLVDLVFSTSGWRRPRHRWQNAKNP